MTRDTEAPLDEGSPDGGYTLVELIIVCALVGLVATVIAASFVLIARVNPQSENVVDDSRTLLGLTNWLELSRWDTKSWSW